MVATHIVKARLVEGDHVDVALHQHQVGPLGALGEVEGVDQPALVEHHGLRGVQVLGPLHPRQDAAGEAHHIPPHIDDGEHEPGAELVVDAAVFPSHRQARVDEFHLAVALFREGPCQAVPLVGGGPQAEAGGGAGGELPLGDVVPHPRAPPGFSDSRGRTGRRPCWPPEAGPAFSGPPRRCPSPAPPSPPAGPAGAPRNRYTYSLHDKGDYTASLAAAEAVVDLLIRRDGKGGGLFVVKGAQAPQVVPLLGQVDIGGNHVGDLAAGTSSSINCSESAQPALLPTMFTTIYQIHTPCAAAIYGGPTSRSRTWG